MMKKMLMQLTIILGLVFTFESIAEQTREVRIPWKNVPEAVGYEFEINNKLHNVVETSITLNLVPGQYRFRLRSVDPAGSKSVWSDWKNFQVQPRFKFSDMSQNESNSVSNLMVGGSASRGIDSKDTQITQDFALPLEVSGDWRGEIPKFSQMDELFAEPKVQLGKYMGSEKKSYRLRR